jgi:HD-GYP domain-containing protein (c-di-GMP phosphodiesterase class II)
MRDGRGKHFDPEVLDAFLDVIEQQPIDITPAQSDVLTA